MEQKDDQLYIYRGLTDIILKFLFGIVALAVFIAVAYCLLGGECGWEDKIVYASVEGLLAISASRIFKHYWPVAD